MPSLVISSCAVQIFSLVVPQNQLSGPLLSPTGWPPNQHHAAMLADISWLILGRTEGRGLGFGQLVHTHTGKTEIPVLFRWALRPHCCVVRQKIVVCWASSSFLRCPLWGCSRKRAGWHTADIPKPSLAPYLDFLFSSAHPCPISYLHLTCSINN